MKRFLALTLVLCLVAPVALIAAATETVDYEAVTSIRQEGFRNSQVMQVLSELTDRIGPRLTGSPAMKQANEWTRDKLAEYGLSNAHLEKWGPFGRGWSEEFTSVRMTAPATATLFAIPRAWTPSTPGAVKAEVVRVKIDKNEDFDKYRGQLAGKIVITGDPRDIKEEKEAASIRYSDEKLAELAQYNIPGDRTPSVAGMTSASAPPSREEIMRRFALARETAKFFADEKVAAVLEPSRFNEGEITMSGTRAYQKGESEGVPTLNMAVEHWGRIVRLLDRKVPVELEVNVKTKFYDDDPYSYNTIADIPGTDKKIGDEVVMMGAHLDSWHGGTGATDNAAGAAIVMEAARILKALDLKPRRTIRVALWSGEEQGLYGSRAYVEEHLASRPEPTDPKERELPSYLRRASAGPLTFKPEYKKVSAYFNIDNGTGKLRGIYCQENAAVCPIFAQWLEPFRDLGVTTVSMRNTGSTDHVPFDGVGVPGFQFIQDPVEYFTRTHHTNMDVYERIQRDDVMQAAVVLASVVWQAANRDQMLPRKPLPKDAVKRADATKPATPAAAASTATGGGK